MSDKSGSTNSSSADALRKLVRSSLARAQRLVGPHAKQLQLDSDQMLNFHHQDMPHTVVRVSRKALEHPGKTMTCVSELLTEVGAQKSGIKPRSVVERQIRLLQKAAALHTAIQDRGFVQDLSGSKVRGLLSESEAVIETIRTQVNQAPEGRTTTASPAPYPSASSPSSSAANTATSYPVSHFVSSFSFDPMTISLVYVAPLPAKEVRPDAITSVAQAEAQILEYARPCGYVITMRPGEKLTLCGAMRVALCQKLQPNSSIAGQAVSASDPSNVAYAQRMFTSGCSDIEVSVNGAVLGLGCGERQETGPPFRHIVRAVSFEETKDESVPAKVPSATVEVFGCGNMIEVHAPSWEPGALLTLEARRKSGQQHEGECQAHVLLFASGVTLEPAAMSISNGFGPEFLTAHRLPSVDRAPPSCDKTDENPRTLGCTLKQLATMLTESLRHFAATFIERLDPKGSSELEKFKSMAAKSSGFQFVPRAASLVSCNDERFPRILLACVLPALLVHAQNAILSTFCWNGLAMQSEQQCASDALPFAAADVDLTYQQPSGGVKCAKATLCPPFQPPLPESLVSGLTRLEINDILRGVRAVFGASLTIASRKFDLVTSNPDNFRAAMQSVFTACLAIQPECVHCIVESSATWRKIWRTYYALPSISGDAQHVTLPTHVDTSQEAQAAAHVTDDAGDDEGRAACPGEIEGGDPGLLTLEVAPSRAFLTDSMEVDEVTPVLSTETSATDGNDEADWENFASNLLASPSAESLEIQTPTVNESDTVKSSTSGASTSLGASATETKLKRTRSKPRSSTPDIGELTIELIFTHYLTLELLIVQALTALRESQMSYYSSSPLVFPGLPGASFPLLSSQGVSSQASREYRIGYRESNESARSYVVLLESRRSPLSSAEPQSLRPPSHLVPRRDLMMALASHIMPWVKPMCDASGTTVKSLGQLVVEDILRHAQEYKPRAITMASQYDTSTLGPSNIAGLPTPAPQPNFLFKCGAISIGPRWQATLDLLCSAAHNQPGTRRTIPPVVMLVGDRDAGKSTFNRIAVNRLAAAYGKAGLLDTDPGQSEGTPACVLALSLIRSDVDCVLDGGNSGENATFAVASSPITTPPSTRAHLPNSWPFESAKFFGSNTPSTDPDCYVACIVDLLRKWFTAMHNPDGSPIWLNTPLVINTPGWTTGLGKAILTTIMCLARPSVIVEVNNSVAFPSDPRHVLTPTLDVPLQNDVKPQVTEGSDLSEFMSFTEHVIVHSPGGTRVFGAETLHKYSGWLLRDQFCDIACLENEAKGVWTEKEIKRMKRDHISSRLGLRASAFLMARNHMRDGVSFTSPQRLRSEPPHESPLSWKLRALDRSMHDSNEDLLGTKMSLSYNPIVVLLPSWNADMSPSAASLSSFISATRLAEQHRLQQEADESKCAAPEQSEVGTEECTAQLAQQAAVIQSKSVSSSSDGRSYPLLRTSPTQSITFSIPFGKGINYLPYLPLLPTLNLPIKRVCEALNSGISDGKVGEDDDEKQEEQDEEQQEQDEEEDGECRPSATTSVQRFTSPIPLRLLRLIAQCWCVSLTNEVGFVSMSATSHMENVAGQLLAGILKAPLAISPGLTAAATREQALLGYLTQKIGYTAKWDRWARGTLIDSSDKSSFVHTRHGGERPPTGALLTLPVPVPVDTNNCVALLCSEVAFTTKIQVDIASRKFSSVRAAKPSDLFAQIAERTRFISMLRKRALDRMRTPGSEHERASILHAGLRYFGESLDFHAASRLTGTIVGLALDVAPMVPRISARLPKNVISRFVHHGFQNETQMTHDFEAIHQASNEWYYQATSVASPFFVGIGVVTGIDIQQGSSDMAEDQTTPPSDGNAVAMPTDQQFHTSRPRRPPTQFVLEIATPTPINLMEKVNLLVPSYPNTAQPPSWLLFGQSFVTGGAPLQYLSALSGRNARGTGSNVQKSRSNIVRK